MKLAEKKGAILDLSRKIIYFAREWLVDCKCRHCSLMVTMSSYITNLPNQLRSRFRVALTLAFLVKSSFHFIAREAAERLTKKRRKSGNGMGDW